MFQNKFRYIILVSIVFFIGWFGYKIEQGHSINSIIDSANEINSFCPKENEKIDVSYGLKVHYFTEDELRDFKICSKKSLAQTHTVRTILTYSKEFDDRPKWTIFKDLVSGRYRMYFDLSIDKNNSIQPEYCFYDAGIFQDNMLLKDVPYGSIGEIYFLKYDKDKKQYYGKKIGRSLDMGGMFKDAPRHKLILPPQTVPRRKSGRCLDVNFYIQPIH